MPRRAILVGSCNLVMGCLLACSSGGTSSGPSGTGGVGNGGTGGATGGTGGGSGGAGGTTGGVGGGGTAGSAGSATGGSAGGGGSAGTAGSAGAAGATGGAGGSTGGAGGTPSGNHFISGPSISSRGPGILDVFAVGNVGGVLYQKYYDAVTGWLPIWAPLEGNISSDVDSVSWGSSRVDVVGLGTDNNIYQKVFTGVWDTWGQLTNTNDWKYSPTVATPAPNVMWVFGIGTTTSLWARYWGGSSWGNWTDLGGDFTSAPDAWGLWPNPNQYIVYLVGKGTNNQIYRMGGSKFLDTTAPWTWTPFQQLPPPPGGGGFDSGPAICGWVANKAHVFARKASDQHLWHISSDNGVWSAWEDLGGVLTSDPDCVSWGPNRLDVVARGGGNHIFHIYWDGAWSAWEDLGVY